MPTNDRIYMMMMVVPLTRKPDGRRVLLSKLRPIYVVNFYLFHIYNSLINCGVGLKCIHTSIFIEALSLEGLPTKTSEDPSPHEIILSPAGHQPSIFKSRGDYYYYYYYYYHHHHHHYHHYFVIFIIICSTVTITNIIIIITTFFSLSTIFL